MNRQLTINWKAIALITIVLLVWAAIGLSHFTRTAATSTMQWSVDTCRWGDGWMR